MKRYELKIKKKQANQNYKKKEKKPARFINLFFSLSNDTIIKWCFSVVIIFSVSTPFLVSPFVLLLLLFIIIIIIVLIAPFPLFFYRCLCRFCLFCFWFNSFLSFLDTEDSFAIAVGAATIIVFVQLVAVIFVCVLFWLFLRGQRRNLWRVPIAKRRLFDYFLCFIHHCLFVLNK